MGPKKKFDPRKLMEKAIEVMKQSINEPREDGKASPKVGAVLYKPDGTIETACRGELRYGDHAEFTLLERKHRQEAVDGSILFATLEPCAPGARKHPKLSCAERIVNARIKEVYIGIEDPDPTVDRKGIAYLEKHGIKVHIFPRELQEQIREANKEFLAQALQRASKEPNKNEVLLSSLDQPAAFLNFDHFSSEAFNYYRAKLGISESWDTAPFKQRLLQMGLVEQTEPNTFIPSGYGMLMFGKAPRNSFQQAGLLATVDYPNGKKETKNFEGPYVLMPKELEEWLDKVLALTIDRSRMERTTQSEVPFELIREAIVNALVHRDYTIEGAKCQLTIDPDTVVIKSPGGPLSPITLEQIQSLNAPMLSRNPKLHYIFAQIDAAEERGLGLKSLKTKTEEMGLPLPKYCWEDPYLVLTLFRHTESASSTLDLSILNQLSPEERKGWNFLSSKTGTTQGDYTLHLKVTARTAQRHLTHFVELGLLQRVGRGPSTRYLKP